MRPQVSLLYLLPIRYNSNVCVIVNTSEHTFGNTSVPNRTVNSRRVASRRERISTGTSQVTASPLRSGSNVHIAQQHLPKSITYFAILARNMDSFSEPWQNSSFAYSQAAYSSHCEGIDNFRWVQYNVLSGLYQSVRLHSPWNARIEMFLKFQVTC